MRIPFPVLISTICLILIGGCTPPPTIEKPAAQEQTKADPTRLSITPGAAKAAGVKVVAIEDRTASSDIQTTGTIQADENRVFHINSLAPGRVVDDKVSLGDVIRPKQVLAVIENLEVAKVYADFIRRYHENETAIKDAQTRLDLATSNFKRLKQLYDEKIGSQKDYLQGQSDLALADRAVVAAKEKSTHIEEEARSLLSAYGVTLKNIESETIETTSPIVSPRYGVITKKSITVGDVVNVQQTLYEVADLSQVWLDVSVFDKDLRFVKEGEAVTFSSDSVAGHSFKGIIDYIKPSTGDNVRTFLARANIKNMGAVLKPGMFGQVKVIGANKERKPFIPDAALQSHGNEKFVFVEESPDHFVKKTVVIAKQLENGYLIESGINSGLRVVCEGSLKLKAELFKSSFAGDD